MKIKVSPQTLSMFKENLHKILLMNESTTGAQLYVVSELESIVESEDIQTSAGGFFRKREVKTEKVSNIYITHIVMETVHPTGRFLGTLTDEACERFIILYDLYKLRQQWLYMVEEIKLMGFDLTRIEKPIIIPEKTGSK